MWTALAAGIGCGVCAYAGLYPRFDDGALRLVLALTSAPFAAAVVASSSSARSGARAFGMALLLAALLGMASTVIPAAILTHSNASGEFFVACLFGGFFGALTGVIYGVPLAILSAASHRQVRAQTHESTDRAARVAGAWLFFVSLVGLAGTRLLDEARMDWATERMVSPSTLPSLVACLAALAGIAAVVRASVRLRRRSAWLDRVRSGLEPAFRVRVADLRDRIDGLPRLGEGATVVEFVADASSDATSGAAYRMSATGTAVAIVSDDSSRLAT